MKSGDGWGHLGQSLASDEGADIVELGESLDAVGVIGAPARLARPDDQPPVRAPEQDIAAGQGALGHAQGVGVEPGECTGVIGIQAQVVQLRRPYGRRGRYPATVSRRRIIHQTRSAPSILLAVMATTPIIEN